MSVHYCSQVWSKLLIVEKLTDENLLECATIQTLWKAGTVYVSGPGEESDTRADILNEMRLGAGVRLSGVARFKGALIRSPALTLQCSDASRGGV